MRLAPPESKVALLALLSLCASSSACKGSSSTPSAAEAGPPPVASAAPSALASPPASLAFLNGFEGEIDATMKEAKTPNETVPLALLIKGDKIRANVPEKLAKQAG